MILLRDGASFVVRRLGASDAEALHAHVVRCASTTDQVLTMPGDLPSVEVLRNDFDRVFAEERGGVMLGVFDPGDPWSVVGHVGLAVRRMRRVAHVGTLGMMLEPAQRGRGLGRTLVERLLGHARRHPALHRVDLEVLETNAAGRALYERCGLVEEGRKGGAFRADDGAFVDALVMSVWVGAAV